MINHLGPSGTIEALTYQYDAAGNRTSLTRNNAAASLLPAAVASATYDAANEQTAFAGATLTYDNNGNLTNDGVNTYQWDARNRLASISGGVTASFKYDAFGRRTSKVVGSAASQFLYDGNDIAAEIGSGSIGASYLRSLNIDEPFVRQAGTGNEFYHTDALGSSLTLSNPQGASTTMYTYEPFGKTTASGASSNSVQFTGRESDGTGLLYYRARYYAPRLSRFATEDPLQLRGGDANYYAYVLNNPLLLRDPLGLLTMGQGIGLGCGLGGVGGASGARKDRVAGAATGGALGCLFGTLIASGLPPLPPTPVGIAIGLGVGAVTGGITGGLTAAAGGGTPVDIALSALGGAAGGAISNVLPVNPVLGAFIGTGVGAFLGAIGPP